MKFRLVEDNLEEYDNEGNKLTQEQINFFRNSKIRAKNGSLMVCYHGTSAKFDEFDISYSWDSFGFHFGTLKAAQDRDGAIIKKVYLNIKNPFYIDDDLQYWDAVGFTEYFLEHEDRVKELPLLQKEWEKIKEQWEEDEMEEDPDTSYWDEEFGDVFRNAFYKSKYDGIVYKNYGEDVGSISYMAFYPNQIKAITNKNPSSSRNINEELKKIKTINNDEIELNIESTPKIGAAFITKEGRFINIGNNEHSSIFKIPKEELDHIDISYYFYDLEDNYDLIKLNSGTKYEDYTYIDLWKRPNRNQQQALIEWLYMCLDNRIFDISVVTKDREIMIDLKKDVPEDIIKEIIKLKDINESIDNKKIKVYRVGKLHDGTNFFTDNLDYYEKSDTGYKRENAKEYELDLSNCKVWEPIKELGLDVYTWSTIWGKIKDFEENNIMYEFVDDAPEDTEWAITDTDWLAQAGKENGYDVVILRDIPNDAGYGKKYTEYAVNNLKYVKEIEKTINESEEKQLRNKEDVFDRNNQEIPHYKEYLENPRYANKKYNTISEIVEMSPNEYFRELETIFPGTTIEREKRGMNNKEERKIIDGMKDTILNTNKKLPMTYLNYAYNPSQEGRHRMVAVGELYGWDEKFPVLIVKWTKEQEEEYNRKKISKYIEKAVNKTLDSWYTNYDEFLEELQYQVEEILLDEEEKMENYNVRETNSTFILQTNGIEYLIEKDDIKIREESELDDDFDWTDTLDDEEINKLLKELENGKKWWK